MLFGPLQLEFFNADEGAYSIVTADERAKGQITLTEADGEADIAIRAIGAAHIPRSAARSFPLPVYVRRPDGTETPAELTINFPKVARNELRIYRKATEGFGYQAADVWFIYRRGERLVVGAMLEAAWRSLGRQDADDDIYIDLAAGDVPASPRVTQALRYHRDPALARRRFRQASYQCEFDPDHRLFTGRVTRQPFLEPHHLVPVSLQARYPRPLDHLDNIFALCPHCHRAVHHAETSLVTEIITTLAIRRGHVCQRLGISPDDILRLYNCEVIRD